MMQLSKDTPDSDKLAALTKPLEPVAKRVPKKQLKDPVSAPRTHAMASRRSAASTDFRSLKDSLKIRLALKLPRLFFLPGPAEKSIKIPLLYEKSVTLAALRSVRVNFEAPKITRKGTLRLRVTFGL